MKNEVTIGHNRTGVARSSAEEALAEVTRMTVPSMEGDEAEIADARAEYIDAGAVVGTVPAPVSAKGTRAGTSAGVPLLLDKLSERLAFERMGTRLYAAVIGKCAASEPLAGGPSVGDLERIHDQERGHFELVREAILSIGADPTAMTPSADLVGVASSGILQIVADPRTSLEQSLEAMLIAELVDNDGWALLAQLTRAAGHEQMALRFEQARVTEDEHVADVRRWISDALLGAVVPPPRSAS